MKARSIVLICAGILLVCAGLPGTAAADTSHIRIIRLSLVQGDVRFASSFHGDPLTDTKAVWQTAPLNMPIREGSALATGTGRAEVEFENGAMAFLSENSVLEFYDLSLHDGEKITRLVLRQGSAIFYTHSQTGDYFSVTGGDFTVEAGVRSRFRINNFDDGSTVDVEGGQVSVLRDEKSTPLEKGQSLSVRASDPKNQVIARADTTDDFDRWVSGRIDSVVTATNYTNQFTSTTNYTSGFSDLYTFGSWLSMPGYGYGWRPFGVGLGWCPFDAAYGNWYMDASIGGWSFIGSAPWGWLPYHYGGWIYAPAYGWMWTPNGFGGAGGRPIMYRPVTAVWVNTGGALGFVPAHPQDKNGKTPMNITRGVYPVEGNTIASPVAVANGEKVSVVKHLPANALVAGNVGRTTAPVPVSRALPASTFTTRPAGPGIVRQSSITYDPAEHRFVNSGQVAAAANAVTQPRSNVAKVNEATAGRGALPPVRATTSVPTAGRNSVPARPAMTPAPARAGGSSGGSSGGGGGWGGGRSPASSAGSSMPASSAGSSRPSSAGGGGRPH